MRQGKLLGHVRRVVIEIHERSLLSQRAHAAHAIELCILCHHAGNDRTIRD